MIGTITVVFLHDEASENAKAETGAEAARPSTSCRRARAIRRIRFYVKKNTPQIQFAPGKKRMTLRLEV